MSLSHTIFEVLIKRRQL